MMPRVLLSFFVCLLVFFGILHYFKEPPEAYLPPPSLYNNATYQVIGYITGKETKDLGDHLLEGSDTFYYADYEFRPYVYVADKHGKPTISYDANWYTGAVRIDETTYRNIEKEQTVLVHFDPVDPNINGVKGTLGVWSRTTGYMNKYLWWYIGLIVATYLLQEAIRMLTKTNDLG
jgi:hypothetical protein